MEADGTTSFDELAVWLDQRKRLARRRNATEIMLDPNVVLDLPSGRSSTDLAQVFLFVRLLLLGHHPEDCHDAATSHDP